MLFSSYAFVFVFLPITFLGVAAIGPARPRRVAAWLLACSMVFYAWWNPGDLLVLMGSMLFNFAVGARLMARAAGEQRRGLLAAGIVMNLLLLAYFKYAGFLLQSLALLPAGPAVTAAPIPLGVSFFTFTQIAFLVDVYRRGGSDYSLLDYGLFVTWFPHLIAGPIYHHGEMLPQFRERFSRPLDARELALGLTLFTFGLFKKVVLADGLLAPHAEAAFSAVEKGAALPLTESWVGPLAFGLQIYFDFSGYSDMAMGLSLALGIRLPVNFDSPYKSCSIVEFWRRWHMTLSRWLRDYLYIPLGGGRGGPLSRYRNILITMLLGGLWHGAGWLFVIWGGLHGLLLVANHVWREQLGPRLHIAVPGSHWLAWGLTFAAVTVAWVFFRATTLEGAWELLRGMGGMNGFALPEGWDTRWDLPTSAGDYRAGGGALALLALLVGIVRFAPNAQQIMGRFEVALDTPRGEGARAGWWNLGPLFGLAAGCLFAISVARFGNVAPFLYFQF